MTLTQKNPQSKLDAYMLQCQGISVLARICVVIYCSPLLKYNRLVALAVQFHLVSQVPKTLIMLQVSKISQ